MPRRHLFMPEEANRRGGCYQEKWNRAEKDTKRWGTKLRVLCDAASRMRFWRWEGMRKAVEFRDDGDGRQGVMPAQNPTDHSRADLKAQRKRAVSGPSLSSRPMPEAALRRGRRSAEAMGETRSARAGVAQRDISQCWCWGLATRRSEGPEMLKRRGGRVTGDRTGMRVERMHDAMKGRGRFWAVGLHPLPDSFSAR